MKKTWILTFGFLLLGGPDFARAGAPKIKVRMDLATHGTEETYPVQPGQEIENLAIAGRKSDASYTVAVEPRKIDIPTLSTASFSASLQPPSAGARAVSTSIPLNVELKRCWELVITIVETTKDGKTQAWQRTYTTGKCGEWRTSYGFTFVPDRDERYFSKEVTPSSGGSAGTATPATEFSIVRENDRRDLKFLPSIFFTWNAPEKNHGWAFGLGHDLENVALFAGYGVTKKENITATFGVAIHEATELAGRYSEGDKLKESLDSAQLVEESFVPNLYFGVTFRFGSNIFEQRAAAQKKVAEAKVAAEKATRTAEDAAKTAAAKKDLCKKTQKVANLEAVKGCGQGDQECLGLEAAKYEEALAKCEAGEEPSSTEAAPANNQPAETPSPDADEDSDSQEAEEVGRS